MAKTQVLLQAGDTVQARAVQNSGGQLNILAGGQTSPALAMTWLAPGP